MSSSLPPLLLDVTEDEERCGFTVIKERSGVEAVVRDLPAGLRAVKVRADDGSVHYAVCDAEYRPLYQPAKSLLELLARFGQPR